MQQGFGATPPSSPSIFRVRRQLPRQDQDWAAVRESVRKSQLQKLSYHVCLCSWPCADNQIGDEGVLALTDLIRVNRSVSKLLFGRCHLHPASPALVAFSDALVHNDSVRAIGTSLPLHGQQALDRNVRGFAVSPACATADGAFVGRGGAVAAAGTGPSAPPCIPVLFRGVA